MRESNVEACASELLPCPHCGSPLVILNTGGFSRKAHCKKMGSGCFYTTIEFTTEKRLVEFVNSRPSHPPQNVEAGDAAKGVVEAEWLIWSNEHGAWWKADSKGYSVMFADAGRYSFDEAVAICNGANFVRGGNRPNFHNNASPPETMVPASDRLRLALSATSSPSVLDDTGHPIESPEMLHDFNATSSHGEKGMGDDAAFCNAIEVVFASAERLREAEGLLRRAHDNLQGFDEYATSELSKEISAHLSPTPAQTPGDERRG